MSKYITILLFFTIFFSACQKENDKLNNNAKLVIYTSKSFLTETDNIDFAGFTINCNIKEDRREPELFIQISKEKTFSTILKSEKLKDAIGKQDYKVTDLEPHTIYFYRIKTRYTDFPKEEIHYSDIKETKTKALPNIYAHIVDNPEEVYGNYFEVICDKIKSNNIETSKINYTAEISKDKDFKHKQSKSINWQKRIIHLKEPHTKFYIRYKALYKGNSVEKKDSIDFKFNYCVEVGTSCYIKGNHTKTYKESNKTITEIGEREKIRLVCQIKDFKGIGIYKLKTGNAINDTYLYYLNSKSDIKYFLKNEIYNDNDYVDVYRETEYAYYIRIVNKNGYSSNLNFEQLEEGNKKQGHYSIDDLYFIIKK